MEARRTGVHTSEAGLNATDVRLGTTDARLRAVRARPDETFFHPRLPGLRTRVPRRCPQGPRQGKRVISVLLFFRKTCS